MQVSRRKKKCLCVCVSAPIFVSMLPRTKHTSMKNVHLPHRNCSLSVRFSVKNLVAELWDPGSTVSPRDVTCVVDEEALSPPSSIVLASKKSQLRALWGRRGGRVKREAKRRGGGRTAIGVEWKAVQCGPWTMAQAIDLDYYQMISTLRAREHSLVYFSFNFFFVEFLFYFVFTYIHRLYCLLLSTRL